MLNKTYDASEAEERIYNEWEKSGAFKASAGSKPGATPFCIVIPPPNVTGSLHMGHALNNTLQDILVRYQRMKGCDVLWQPGMDHAGIATQMVVERQLAERENKVTRRELGRKKFIDCVWDWKAESGGMIINQLRRLGASCDWSRERFTMDAGLSTAVIKVFVELHKLGLIYKDKRLVNWDPKFHTAISDLEVEQTEIDGNLWHFQYPIENQKNKFIVIATTRPETMLGDTAIAVNPNDKRYKDLVGKHAVLPLVGRKIPIIADEYADPEAGSGAVKITPAHDFNDFEVGKRHNLPMISIMDRNASIHLKDNIEFLEGLSKTKELSEIIDQLDGLDRFEARRKIVELLDKRGLMQQDEPHRHSVPHGDRSQVPIEPFLTDQWYVDAKKLAKPAIESIRSGRTKFVPKNWENTYFDWMENIQPWCISRQLWWGHQIPAWYGPDGNIFVEKSESELFDYAKQHYGKEIEILEEEVAREKWESNTDDKIYLYQDQDVLDTWFSSALWSFSTLGWPEQTEELKRYYPTSVLITGFDIIFFWVARMMMFGLQFMEQEPFDTVYIHALVRDEHGAKMSKSKGNIIDPLELMNKHSADALRFTLAAMAAQGRDIKMSENRVVGYRNFSTKLWNAARFAEMNGCERVENFDPKTVSHSINQWIIAEVIRCESEISSALKHYRFNDAANAVYKFVWHTYCDWYLELIKPVFSGNDREVQVEIRATAAWVLDEMLKLLHPFMPFITEELWQRTGMKGPKRDGMLILAKWPTHDSIQSSVIDEVNWMINVISEIRSVRAELNVPAGAFVPLAIVNADENTSKWMSANDVMIKRLARIEEVNYTNELPQGAAQIVIGEAAFCIPLANVIDLEAEIARQQKVLDKIDIDIKKIEIKLENPKFVEKAPKDLVEDERMRLENLIEQSNRVKEIQSQLS